MVPRIVCRFCLQITPGGLNMPAAAGAGGGGGDTDVSFEAQGP